MQPHPDEVTTEWPEFTVGSKYPFPLSWYLMLLFDQISSCCCPAVWFLCVLSCASWLVSPFGGGIFTRDMMIKYNQSKKKQKPLRLALLSCLANNRRTRHLTFSARQSWPRLRLGPRQRSPECSATCLQCYREFALECERMRWKKESGENKYSPRNPWLLLMIKTTRHADKCPVERWHSTSFLPLQPS